MLLGWFWKSDLPVLLSILFSEKIPNGILSGNSPGANWRFLDCPLDITLREIPPPYVDPSKPGRRTYKRWSGVGESFPTRKNKCSVCRDFGHKKTIYQNRNATQEVLSVVLLNFNECSLLFEDDLYYIILFRNAPLRVLLLFFVSESTHVKCCYRIY